MTVERHSPLSARNSGLAPPFLLLLGILIVAGAASGTVIDDVDMLLRQRIELAHREASATMVAADTRIRAVEQVSRYYRENEFEPGWTGPDGPTLLADSLLATLRDADLDGLRPSDYHVSSIDSLRNVLRTQSAEGKSMDPRALADFELLCTDAFLLYGGHLLQGRVDPEALVPTWTLDRRQADLTQELHDALRSGTIRASLHDLRPPQPGYSALRRSLAHYRNLAAEGGWASIPAGPILQEGMRDDRIPVIRDRLRATGELSAGASSDSLHFDERLRHAVSRFQERHGLDIDGAVGPATRSAMNVPVEDRIRRIEINMERWRWLPQDLGDPHVRVNIADYWLRVVEDQENVLQMRVVVGTEYRQTPIFSDRISYIVFSPYWHVPPSIAAEDKLPEFQRDPSLVSRHGFEVFEGWGADARAIDPSTIDWSELSPSSFPYRLRQKPGPYNALGRVKFMFPNRHNVYLHDTPSRSLFNRSERNFSSGCIRVEYPVELAEYLLGENGGWSTERIEKEMQGDDERAVVLQRKLPVHLLYWTAWMEDDALHFRKDIYGRDSPVASALSAPLSKSPQTTGKFGNG